MMHFKQGLDALIESTMAFAKDVKHQPVPDLSAVMGTAEQALTDTSKPIPPITIAPASERDEIRQRVDNFRAHQEKMAREREDYYLQVKAKMMAPFDPPFVELGKNPQARTDEPLMAGKVSDGLCIPGVAFE
jgi:hypothetical protein